MKSRLKILILLACISLIAPAICAEIDIGGGSDNMVSSPDGIVSGGDFMTTDVDTSNELGFTAGVRAHAEIPEGSDGFAYSHWTRNNNTSMSLSATNGMGYVLTVGYGGTVSADVTKTSLMGVAMSDAQISAHAHANADTNQIDGNANINASTSNTGLGQTRALAVGNASYDVRQTDSMGAPGKAVFGNANGVIDLHSVNLDSGVTFNSSGVSTDMPEGSVSGSAYIRSMSEANNFTSRSNATMSTDSLTAMRLGKDGVSHIGATVMGNATAATSNGGTTSNMTSNTTMGTGNESTLATVKGALGSMANAYAPGDVAIASSKLRSDAISTMGGFTNMTNTTDGSNNETNETIGNATVGSFINATSTANTSVYVSRTDTSFPATAASAESMISNGSVNATSRNSTSTTSTGNDTEIPSAAMADAGARRLDLRSAISAKNAWTGNNSISVTIAGSQNESAVDATITDKIVNNGPPMNSSVADFSIADLNATWQHARATNETSTASVDLANTTLLSFINGNTSTPGGLAVLGPVSDPVFNNDTGVQTNVTGPMAMPGNETGQNSNVIIYSASARQMMNSSTNSSNSSPI